MEMAYSRSRKNIYIKSLLDAVKKRMKFNSLIKSFSLKTWRLTDLQSSYAVTTKVESLF